MGEMINLREAWRAEAPRYVRENPESQLTEFFVSYRPRHPGMPSWPAFMAWMDRMAPFAGYNRALWRATEGLR